MPASVSAKSLFRQPCHFVAGAATAAALPDPRLVEVAVAGRSNVGKSSLLNALLKRKQLARTSKKPGCTRQINFFSLADQLMLVDLPGYGYAQVSRKEAVGWGRMIESYLHNRPTLRAVLLLIDARHGLKETDLAVMDLLDRCALSYRVVLTKADKATGAGIEALQEALAAQQPLHPALHPEVVVTSAHAGKGMDDLRQIVANFLP